jgi:hypothetical protein
VKNKLSNYAFIDSQNVYLSIKNQGWKIDFAKFRRYLKEKYLIFLSRARHMVEYLHTKKKPPMRTKPHKGLFRSNIHIIPDLL